LQTTVRMTDDDDTGLSPRVFLIGLFMGTADAVPGVSGGTIALLAGIYDRLIDAVTGVTPEAGARAVRALLARDTAGFWAVVEDTDALFLGTLGVGLVSALVVVSRVVHYAEVNHPVALFGFFFGLILASALVLTRQISLDTTRHAVAAVAGFLVAFALSGNVELLAGQSLALTFLAGTVAISAMILPGVSGALILVVLGQYTYLTETLSTFTDAVLALATGGALDRVLDLALTVFTFVAGALVGLFTIARLVDRALEADRQTTLAFLVALVVGALRAPVNEISGRDALAWTNDVVAQFLVVAALGAVLLFALDRYAVDIDLDGDVDVAIEDG
jgi:putative membrane protein